MDCKAVAQKEAEWGINALQAVILPLPTRNLRKIEPHEQHLFLTSRPKHSVCFWWKTHVFTLDIFFFFHLRVLKIHSKTIITLETSTPVSA